MEAVKQTEQELQVTCITCLEIIPDRRHACEVWEKDTNTLVGYLHHTYSCVLIFLQSHPVQERDNE